MYKNIIAKFLFFASVFLFQFALADGTRQVSPGNGSGSANANGTAYLINPNGPSGSYPGSNVNTKLKVTINNFNTERILSGFMARTLSSTNSAAVTNAYIRITSPSNTVVFQNLIPSTGAGYIANYNRAWNGPNLGNNTAGYTPFNYTPTANGEYTIELYRSTDGGATPSTGTAGQITFPLFDISVATVTGTAPSQTANVISGRLWSREWSFVTTNLSSTADPAAYPNTISASFDGSFHVYTNDGFKAQVIFRPNFRPLGFQLVMNYWGIANTGNFTNDNKSRNGTFTAPNTISYPVIPDGYRVFLTGPDATAFPNGVTGNPAITSGIYGCPGAYFIPYYVDKAGDVAVTLDLNGVPGYQSGTADRILQAYDIPVGNNVMAWNGLNGLGGTVPVNFAASVSVLLLQGRVNIPMIDAELNTNGFSATATFPALGNRPLFWDDTGLTGTGLAAFGSAGNNNSNLTTGGVKTTDLRSGILGPTHAWDGSGPTTGTPAPLTTGQGSNTIDDLEDDFGNARIINTWFYGSQAESVPQTLRVPSCDNDGDGIPDNTDLDDDNDGILDALEYGYLPNPLGDHDADGVPNYIDPQAPGFIDTNLNGVDDRYDLDGDGIINQFDTDSDGDGCADAIESSEYVTAAQIHSLTLPTSDANYNYRGQIRVIYNGTTVNNNPAQIISMSALSNGVPQLVNPSGSNLNSVTNSGNAAGVADNTDGTSDVGQELGLSQNALRSGCLDSDNDGIPNEDDLDDDNDGILDSSEGLCATTSVAATDGFDNPVVTNVNVNNLQTTNPFNGWTAVTPNTNTLLGSNAFNVIRVNGSDYTEGPDFAQSGNQYLDINGTATIYKQFTFTTPTVVSASAWFANRATADGAYVPYTTRIEIINTVTNALVQGNLLSFTKVMANEGWYQSSISNVVLPAGTYRIRMYIDNYSHVDSITYCFSTDTDGDNVPNHLDLDSDGDTCADAIEGDAAIRYTQVNNASSSNSGQIKVLADGQTTGTPSTIINQTTGVPLLAGTGQAIGSSQNSAVKDAECDRCFRPATSPGVGGLDTTHGITALTRAGNNNGNWPMKIKGGYTALDAKTNGFVVNRVAFTAQNVPTNIAPASFVKGMMVYDITNNCLKIYDGTVWSCYTKQTCDDFTQ